MTGIGARTSLAIAAWIAMGLASHAYGRPTSLFDGHSLTGWHAEMIADNGVSADAASLFRPENGALHVYAGAPDGSAQPHAILVTDRSYADYRLHVEYRWGRNIFAARKGQPRDAGLLIHIGAETPGLVRTWYRWPKSLEYQIMEGDTGSAYVLKARAVGSVAPGTQSYSPASQGGIAKPVRLMDDDRTSFKLARAIGAREKPGWNSLDVEARDNRAAFYLNGALVNVVEGIEDDRPGEPVPMRRGNIALQAESAEVFYRNIRIEPLPPKKEAP